MASLTKSLQDLVVARLAPLAVEGVPVHGLTRGDLVSRIEAAIAGAGLVVLVLPPLVRSLNGNIASSDRGPFADRVGVTVRVVEDLLFVGGASSSSAHEVIERVIVSLAGWTPSGGYPLAIDPEPVREVIEGNTVVLEVSLTTKGNLSGSAVSSTLPSTPLTSKFTDLAAYDSIDLTAGEIAVESEWAGLFVETPRTVLVRVLAPTGQPALTFTESTADRSTTGFSGALSAAPAVSGYKLSYLAIL